jgi:hypothetical protein
MPGSNRKTPLGMKRGGGAGAGQGGRRGLKPRGGQGGPKLYRVIPQVPFIASPFNRPSPSNRSFEIEKQTRPLIVPDESGGKRKTPIKPKFVTAKPERPLKRFQSGGGVSKSAVRSSSKKPL